MDGKVDGRKTPEDRDFERSLTDADRKAKELLGQKATVFPADTASGKYRGEVLGETDHHVLQKLSPHNVVAHPKEALPDPSAAGTNVIISYSNGLAQLKPNQLREKAHALSR